MFYLRLGGSWQLSGGFCLLSGWFGVDVDQQGNIYVADTGNSRIQKFAPNGSFISKFGSWGPGPGQFKYVRDVKIDADGKIYTCDIDSYNIQIFDSSFTHLLSFGSQGTDLDKFLKPTYVELDSSGNIYVVDREMNRVQKFSPSGQPLTN